MKLPPLGDQYDFSYGLTYVKASNEWVPVPRAAVSSDGARYAYFDGTVFRVVTEGSPDLKIAPPPATAFRWTVLATRDNGLYVECPAVYCYMEALGVWWLPYSGAAVHVTSSGFWMAIDGKYAYGTSGGSDYETAALRLDLSTGSRTTIFNLPGMAVYPRGVAADGRVVILAIKYVTPQIGKPQPVSSELWLAGSGEPVKILEVPAALTVYTVVADAMGTWIATSKGLYLYSTAAGLELASPVAGPLASAFMG